MTANSSAMSFDDTSSSPLIQDSDPLMQDYTEEELPKRKNRVFKVTTSSSSTGAAGATPTTPLNSTGSSGRPSLVQVAGGLEDKPKTPLRVLFRLARSFPCQVLLVLLVIADASFLIYEFASGKTTFESVTLFTSLFFFIEVMVLWGYEGRNYFLFDKYWLYAEAFVLALSFFVEYSVFLLHWHATSVAVVRATKTLRYLRAIRFVRVLIMPKTRLRHLKSALRSLVSADRRRYQWGGYDLDLTYVFSNVIAMSWPSEGKEALYRNHIDNVAAFLDDQHGEGCYEVYNCCSERSYDESKFHYNVVRFGMDDHNPCELDQMLRFSKHVSAYIARNPLCNVAVIHCKGGKGRTGSMTCAYIMYAGLVPDAEAALQHFGESRTAATASKFQGVESPSQDRYVRYFEKLLRLPNMKAPEKVYRITSLEVDFLPLSFWSDISKLWYAVVLQPTSHRVLQYVSNPTVTFDPMLPNDPYGKKKKKTMASPSSPVASDACLSPSSTTAIGTSGVASPVMCSPSRGTLGNSSVVEVADDFEIVGGCQGFTGNMTLYANGKTTKGQSFHRR